MVVIISSLEGRVPHARWHMPLVLQASLVRLQRLAQELSALREVVDAGAG